MPATPTAEHKARARDAEDAERKPGLPGAVGIRQLAEEAACPEVQRDHRAAWFANARLHDAIDATTVLALLDDAERMREENRDLRAYGGMLANCAFNLAQDIALTDRQRHSLDESRRNWDAALERMFASRAVPPAPPEARR